MGEHSLKKRRRKTECRIKTDCCIVHSHHGELCRHRRALRLVHNIYKHPSATNKVHFVCAMHFFYCFVVFVVVFLYFDGPFVKAYRHLSTLTLILDQVCTEVKCIISKCSSSFDFQLFGCILLPAAMCAMHVLSVSRRISNIYIYSINVVCIAFNSSL